MTSVKYNNRDLIAKEWQESDHNHLIRELRVSNLFHLTDFAMFTK